jgi:hypothetical protein
MRQELVDRFGELPVPVQRMFDLAEIKMDATLWSIRSIAVEDHYLCLAYTDPKRIQQLSDKHGGQLRIPDRSKAYWPLWEPKLLTSASAARQPPANRHSAAARQLPKTSPDDALSDAERLAKMDLLAVLRQILRW